MVHVRPGDLGLDLPPARCVTSRRSNSSSVRRGNNTFFMGLLWGSDEIRYESTLYSSV